MANNEEDFQLVKEFLEGNESSFNRLILKYRSRIYWHARKMLGNHEDADDLVQEVLIVLYRKLKDFKFQSSVYTYIYKITSTRAINYIRRLKIKSFLKLDAKEVLEKKHDFDLASNIDDKIKLEKLDKILQMLPVKQREVFILRNYEEMQYEEIAKITGKSIGGLKANYFHALNKVMEKMKNE